MNVNELMTGDYVTINFGLDVSPQLAEVISVDKEAKSAELLPESQNDTIKIDQPDMWAQIWPCPIVCQFLIALGYSEMTTDRAYGWTSRQWTKVSYNRKYIFNLTYNNGSGWNLQVEWLENLEPRKESFDRIHYLHQLQHLLSRYNN